MVGWSADPHEGNNSVGRSVHLTDTGQCQLLVWPVPTVHGCMQVHVCTSLSHVCLVSGSQLQCQTLPKLATTAMPDWLQDGILTARPTGQAQPRARTALAATWRVARTHAPTGQKMPCRGPHTMMIRAFLVCPALVLVNRDAMPVLLSGM